MELHSGQAMQAVTALADIGVGRRRVMDALAGTKTLLCFVDITFNQCNSSLTEKNTFFSSFAGQRKPAQNANDLRI